MLGALVLWVLWLPAPLAMAQLLHPAIKRFEILTPRPFGYVIGDLIRHDILLEVETGFELERRSLPVPGQIDRALELREAEIEESESRAGRRYRITLIYQPFYAPREVKRQAIAGFILTLQGPGGRIELPVAEWPFTLSPLRELLVRKEGEREYMRPDADTPSLDLRGHWLRLAGLGGGTGFLLLYLARYYGLLALKRKRRTFAHAAYDLHRLHRRATDPQVYREALRRVHRAFNETFGAVVFAHQLECFLTQHAAFRPLQPDIAAFFVASQKVFFSEEEAQAMAGYPFAHLEALCRALRAQEKI